MLIRGPREFYLRGQTGATLDGAQMLGTGYGVDDAAKQAEQAMCNAAVLLEEAGCRWEDAYKAKIYVADRAYLTAVTRVIDRHLGRYRPCTHYMIMRGFARPTILCEVDLAGLSAGTAESNGHGLQNNSATSKTQAGRVGDRICAHGCLLEPGTGSPLSQQDFDRRLNEMVDHFEGLLDGLGSAMTDLVKLTVYLGDRHYRDWVFAALNTRFRTIEPTVTELIVDGFSQPGCPVALEFDGVADRCAA